MDAIITCHEEEFAPFFATPRRRSSGWHPILLCGRGPGGLGYLSSSLLSLIGIWRFARTPQRLLQSRSQFIGDRVRAVCGNLGSYGMGGPGFLGLRFHKGWIVYRLWGADGWLTLNGKLFEESLFSDERQRQGAHELVSLSDLKGGVLQSISCLPEQYDLVFSKNDQTLLLSLRRDGTAVPCFRGNSQPKVLMPHEDLKDAIIVSRRGRLWLT